MTDVVAITGVAAGGDGVGRLADGRAVFIPRTTPGDRVRVRDGSLKVRRNFARAEAGAIVEGGAARVAPPCPHYVHDHCGGCQLQHMAYDAQLAAKRRIVGDTLRRIGKLDVADPEIVEAVEEWRYRAKISMDARAAGPAGQLAVGLHPYDRPSFVFPLADCHITDFRLMALWRELRARLALLPSTTTRVTLRLEREERRHVLVESPDAWPADQLGRLHGELAGAGQDVVIWWEGRVVAGADPGFPATAFEQVNPEMGAIVRRWAVEQLGELRGQTAWDLYGGVGDTAALLAARGADVVSVDADERAVAWAQRHLAGSAASVRFIAARAEDVIATLPPPYAAIVNPPRGGLHWDVTLRLTAQPVPRLIYVSCDPATLARDLHRLDVNYEITAVRAFDVFPQTAHVETVVVMEAA